LNAQRVRPHATSKQELDDPRALIDRDLHDAGLAGLSTDRSFATSYNAALQSAKMAIACAGYRVVAKQGHHQVGFAAVELAVGPSVAVLIAYFETCRRKRNQLDYDAANIVSDTEAVEILEKAREFKQEIEELDREEPPGPRAVTRRRPCWNITSLEVPAQAPGAMGSGWVRRTRRSSRLTGLTRWALKPASWERRRSSSLP
jgi:hypothetical protein